MSAAQNVPQLRRSRQLRDGVLTLFGYGINVRVDRGHLLIQDGIGSERRHFRMPRVGHGLRRLIVIGNDGLISLAALRWLADQNAAFVMLERDGRVLATTGPVRPSDARLRRAQALAESSGAALGIARELVSRKLAGQERVVRDKLLDPNTADVIAQYRVEAGKAETMDAIRWLEAQGAMHYWSVWRDLPIMFPRSDLARVPDHWLAFGTRRSPLTGSPRLAVNPPGAMLNYCYALLESEARLAAAALGLDCGLGFIHMDAAARDSLACDLMEPVRPEVDGYIVDWITREPLKREWFFEERNGNCRLQASLAVRLAETAPMWARAVAPIAEWVARQLWSGRKRSHLSGPPTRLTQRYRRESQGGPSLPRAGRTPQRQKLCPGCGTEIDTQSALCRECVIPELTERLKQAAKVGRIAGHTPQALAKQGSTQRQHRKAQVAWSASSQPEWLTERFYAEKIQPKLAGLSASLIASRLGVSRWYAGQIRKGYRSHPRHWQALAKLVETGG